MYGTFPTYVLTVLTLLFSKFNNLLGIDFLKSDIYMFLRSFIGIVSFLIAPVAAHLYFKMFKDKLGSLLTFLLVALNWKLIVFGHYVNADIIITLLTLTSVYFFFNYYKDENIKKSVILSSLFFGLAIGTKITVLLTLPFYLYIFFKKGKLYDFIVFVFIAIGAFLVTNPFSWGFANDFAFRILSFSTKEAGIVFDSVDTSSTKYILGLSSMLTLPVFLMAVWGKWKSNYKDSYHIFLIGIIIFYFLFYSIQARRVDRWLLPILPFMMIYASYGIMRLKNLKIFPAILALIFGVYLYNPILLLSQFQTLTPRSAAYIWLKTEVPISANKLGYTEEGLDPISRVPGMDLRRMGVYSSENAHFVLPENPIGYDYVVIADRPMQNFKKPEVKEKYPLYVQKWEEFEKTIMDPTKFELIKEFTLPKPNLIPLTDIYIYKRI